MRATNDGRANTPSNHPHLQPVDAQAIPQHSDIIKKALMPDLSKQAVCVALRSVLPAYDTMLSSLAANGAWWTS
jgi:hypothetical protein